MAKLIRKSVFETNSSSAHSMVMSTDIDNDHVYKKHFEIVLEDFGWGIESHYDFPTKLGYIINQCLLLDIGNDSLYTRESYDNIIWPTREELFKLLEEKSEGWRNLKKVADKYGFTFTISEDTWPEKDPNVQASSWRDDNYYQFGIDYQSLYGEIADLRKSEFAIACFLLGKGSVLKIDHDNH